MLQDIFILSYVIEDFLKNSGWKNISVSTKILSTTVFKIDDNHIS